MRKGWQFIAAIGLAIGVLVYLLRSKPATAKVDAPLADLAGKAVGKTTVPQDALDRYKNGTATEADFAALGAPFVAEAVLNWIAVNYQGPITSVETSYLPAQQTKFYIAANTVAKALRSTYGDWTNVDSYITWCRNVISKVGHPNIYAIAK